MSKELELTSESSKAARAAASWVVRLHSDQAVQADYEAFESWRNETPVNAAEYDAHQKLWHAARALAKNPEARSILLRPQEQPRPISRRALFGGLGLAAAVTTVMLIPRRAASQTFRSARGERRNIALEEGTSLILNTESELRVELREHERRLYLDNGQCFLKVAEDPGCPFRVFVGDHEIRAIGAEFDVYRDGDQTRVTLTNGVVSIYEASSLDFASQFLRNMRLESMPKNASVVLSMGQQATIIPAGPIMVANVDPRVPLAWQEGRIIFEDTPLGQAVRDVNRYRLRQIVLATPGLASLTISGVFNTDRLDGFVEALIAALPVQVQRDDGKTTVLKSL